MTQHTLDTWRRRGVILALVLAPVLTWAQARMAPDLFIQQLGDELMARVQSDPVLIKGDTERIKALVDERVLPNMAFERMTASTVGPAWRDATPEQRDQLKDAFKTLLVRTYAGAVKHIAGKKLVVLPVRMADGDTEVTVRSEIRSAGSEPVPLGYRLSADGDHWVIYDINVVGIWLVETYRTQFAQQIQKTGLDGLIAALTRLNKGA